MRLRVTGDYIASESRAAVSSSPYQKPSASRLSWCCTKTFVATYGQPYLRYRNVIINNIDYDFADYTSSVGTKFYYNISGTLTLQRTINTQIPDEDQAIQW